VQEIDEEARAALVDDDRAGGSAPASTPRAPGNPLLRAHASLAPLVDSGGASVASSASTTAGASRAAPR
jgi:hypothetical protein